MLSAKWMHVRLWCGSLPSFHLLSSDETELEVGLSFSLPWSPPSCLADLSVAREPLANATSIRADSQSFGCRWADSPTLAD
jgi:hypothetical protein